MAADRARYRITGAVFLIAVAIIVLPMLLDGAGIATPPMAALPPAPAPIQAPDVAPIADAQLASAKALRQRIDADGFQTGNATRLGDPALAPAGPAATDEVPQAWGVQVASFSEHANAVALRDRLRADGYQSVLSEVKGLTGTATRVAIGPIIDRADAAKLEHQLEKRYGLDAMVVQFGQP